MKLTRRSFIRSGLAALAMTTGLARAELSVADPVQPVEVDTIDLEVLMRVREELMSGDRQNIGYHFIIPESVTVEQCQEWFGKSVEYHPMSQPCPLPDNASQRYTGGRILG